MPLYITSLNSGSNGNCYYIGNEKEAVLVDAGISCRETERRMSRLGLSINRVKAIFVSHEHTDHTKGVEVLARKYRLPVYITEATHKNSRLKLDPQQTKSFQAYDSIAVGGLYVNPFPKQHDASEPHSFTISGEGITIGVFTDIGKVCDHVVRNFKRCHAVFLEANYDEIMLDKGSYPFYLKKRIKGDHGHLSNRQALELFVDHRPSHMSLILLSHLSHQNNDMKLVFDLFSEHAGKVDVTIATRYEETALFCIS